jgi:hypothetical protein
MITPAEYRDLMAAVAGALRDREHYTFAADIGGLMDNAAFQYAQEDETGVAPDGMESRVRNVSWRLSRLRDWARLWSVGDTEIIALLIDGWTWTAGTNQILDAAGSRTIAADMAADGDGCALSRARRGLRGMGAEIARLKKELAEARAEIARLTNRASK